MLFRPGSRPLILILSIFALQSARAAPGNVDPSVDTRFEIPGRVETVIRQPDGKLLVGGTFSVVNGVERESIARLNADGSLDNAFVPGPVNDDPYYKTVFSLAVQADKVIAGGYLSHLTNQPASGLVRLNPDGTRDAGFNPPVLASEYDSKVRSAMDRGDGKIVVAGQFGSAHGSYLVRLNGNGTVDPTFNAVINNEVLALIPVADNRWLIGGGFTTVSGQSRPGIARINDDGTLDSSFAAVPLPAGTTIHTLASQSDGKIVYSGTSGSTRLVGRALPNGGADTGFSPAAVPDFFPRATVLPDGDILANGPSTSVDDHGVFQLTRLKPNGSLNPISQPSGISLAMSLLPLANGTTVVGGYFHSLNDNLRYGLGAVLPNGSLSPDFHPDVTYSSQVRRIIPLSGGRWLATGDFAGSKGGGRRAPHYGISRLTPGLIPDDGFVRPIFPKLTAIRAAVEMPDGRLIIGGDSNSTGGPWPRRILRFGPDGAADVSFEVVLGIADVVNDLVLLPDGRLLAAGSITKVNGITRSNLVRLSADGVVDGPFAPSLPAEVTDIALANDGRIYATGASFVSRLQADGTEDPAFNQKLVVTGKVNAVTALPGRRAIIAGEFTSVGGSAVGRIARLDATGTQDLGFKSGSGANGAILAMTLRGDGNIFIAGDFTEFDGQPRKGIAQLTADGALRPEFIPGGGFDSTVNTVALTADGNILAGGFFTKAGGFPRAGFARLEAAAPQSTSPPPIQPQNLSTTPTSSKEVLLIWSGSGGQSGYVIERRLEGASNWLSLANVTAASTSYLDVTVVPGKNYEYRVLAWNNTGDSPAIFSPLTPVPNREGLAGAVTSGNELDLWNNGDVTAAACQADGKIVVAGNFTHVNGIPRGKLVRLNPDGTLDTTFNPGSNPPENVSMIAVQAGGRIIVCGGFTSINGVARSGIVGLLPDGTIDPTFTPDPALTRVYAIAVLAGDKLMIGGYFTSGGRSNLLRLNADGSLDSGFGDASVNSTVSALAVQPGDGKVLAVGAFSTVGGVSTNVARFNPDGSRDASFAALRALNGGSVASTLAIAIQADSKVVFGGNFTTINGQSWSRIARVNDNGTLDSTFQPGSGPDNTVETIGRLADGRLFIGGQFQSYAGQPVTCWATLAPSGALDSAAAAIRHGVVHNFLRQSDGKIIAFGNISSAAGEAHLGLVRLESNAITVDSSFSPQFAKPGTVQFITRQPDGKALVSGNFVSVGGPPPVGLFRPGLFRVAADGSVDSAFNAGSGFNSVPLSASVTSQGRIFVGGAFTSVNGQLRSRIAALQQDGSLDSGFNPGAGTNNTVQTVTAESDGSVTIGGAFTTVAGQTRTRLARLDGNGAVMTDFAGLAGVDGTVRSAQRLSDGKLLIGGAFSTVYGTSRPNIARLQSNGSLDPFTGGTNGQVNVITPEQDGLEFIGGAFTSISTQPRPLVARFASGLLDLSFVPPITPTDVFAALAPDPQGRVYLAGLWNGSSPLRTTGLLRLQPDGRTDRSFDAASSGTSLTALGLIPGGLLVGGAFTEWEGQPRLGLVRILTADSYGPPAVPENLKAQSANAGVTLTWNSVPEAPSYLIERRSLAETLWTPVTTLSASVPGYLDDELLPGSRWFYRIRTFNAAGSSAPTAEVEIILPTNYGAWKAGWGIPESTLIDNDSDNDGIPLLLEYSLDLSPVAADFAGLPSLLAAQDTMSLRFLHARPDIQYAVESSTDCVAWSTDGVNQGTGNPWRVASIPTSGGLKRFLRLRVLLTQP